MDIFDLSHPCYDYPIPIFLAIKISSAKKVKPGISQDKERYLCNLKKTKVIHGISYILSLGSFQAHSGSLGSSSLRGRRALWLLLTRVAWPRLAPSFITAIRHASVSATDRPPDEARACPAQTPTAIGSTGRRCSLPAGLVGGVCTAVWEFPALYVTALLWDCRCRVASEKQGYQGYAPPTFETGPT